MSTDARKRWMGVLGAAKAAKSGEPSIPVKSVAPLRQYPGQPLRPPHATRPLVSALNPNELPTPATGLGLTSDRMRLRMVERLRGNGIHDERVLAAMAAIPRHQFVDAAFASRAYEDSSLPIGHEQTISQPYIVARMIELLCTHGAAGKVLEIGTGCGYQAAVLSRVAREVYSIERIRALHDRARANLRPLRLSNLRMVYGDGMLGLPAAAPFDGMLVAAAARDLPVGLLEQLRIGGSILAPLGDQNQTLCLIVRNGKQSWSRTALEPVRFVPVLGGVV